MLNCFLYQEADEVMSAEALQFEFESIRVAKHNFSGANKLGQGGFGAVYRVNLTLNMKDNVSSICI